MMDSAVEFLHYIFIFYQVYYIIHLLIYIYILLQGTLEEWILRRMKFKWECILIRCGWQHFLQFGLHWFLEFILLISFKKRKMLSSFPCIQKLYQY